MNSIAAVFGVARCERRMERWAEKPAMTAAGVSLRRWAAAAASA